jgi:hypothetical protein
MPKSGRYSDMPAVRPGAPAPAGPGAGKAPANPIEP